MAPDFVNYVIVVHGIGSQRPNETLLPVIDRFAETRTGRLIGDPLTLGSLSSQREARPDRLWIEFEGITGNADSAGDTPFVGRMPEKSDGTNIRFVDLHWATILDQPHGDVAEPVAQWTASTIDRLKIRNADHWIVNTLEVLRAGTIRVEKLLDSKLPGLSNKVFSQFLGDVQLYAEYLPTRGQAVRKFHQTVADLHHKHFSQWQGEEPAPPPRFTIIAHSLGSVLAFDALTFAHAAEGWLHELPGYATGEPPPLDWILTVDSLVTLGSPIDKFLLLWWLNYEHLASTSWLDKERLAPREGELEREIEPARKRPIRHLNYCDEQDPVGHELDVAYSSSAVRAVFGRDRFEERVYTRYATPGTAHVKYWMDRELFRRIIGLTIDERPVDDTDEALQVEWFRFPAFVSALLWSYLMIPLLGTMAATATMLWAIFGSRWHLLWTGVALLLASWLTGLVVRWRQVLVRKRGDDPSARIRERAHSVALAVITTLPVILILLFAAAMAALPAREPPSDWTSWAAWTGIAWVREAAGVVAAAATDLAGMLGLVGAMRWAQESVSAIHILDWSPQASTLELFMPALACALFFGSLLSLRNAVIIYWMRHEWRDEVLEVDFHRYLARDPTRNPEPVGARSYYEDRETAYRG